MKSLVTCLLILVCSLAAHAQYVATPPAYEDSNGTAGQYAGDDSYFYMAIAPNTWKRIPWDVAWNTKQPSTPLATDDFNRGATGSTLLLDGNWNDFNSAFKLFGQRLTYLHAGTAGAITTVSGFLSDQYAQAKTTDTIGKDGIGVLVRGDSRSTQGYGLLYAKPVINNYYTFPITLSIVKISGTYGETVSTLASKTGLTVPVGTVFRLEVRGATLTAYLDGVPQLTVTDSSYTSGMPGVIGQGVSQYSALDDWSAGNL